MTGEAWRRYLQTYVALRRAVGFAMRPEAHLLQDFVEHLERRGHDVPVAQVAVEWASASTESQHVRRCEHRAGISQDGARRRTWNRRARRRVGSHEQASHAAHPGPQRDPLP